MKDLTISLTEDYQVVKIDDLNWATQKRKVYTKDTKTKKIGDVLWVIIGYHATIIQAIKDALTDCVDNQQANTLEEYLRNATRTFDKFNECLEEWKIFIDKASKTC